MYNENNGMLLFGEPFEITDRVTVYNPSIGNIISYGEEIYFSAISSLVSTAWDMRLFLYEEGRDYCEVSDFEIFLVLSRSLTPEHTKLILGENINLSELYAIKDSNTGLMALVDHDGETVFDEQIYLRMAKFIRKCHHMKRIFRVPGNEATRLSYMEDAKREELIKKRRKNKPQHSMLAPLISALCNKEGFKYNYNTIRDLSIYAFMDAVYRLQIIDQYQYLMNGLYTGMVSMKGNDMKKELDWMRALD